MTHDTTNTPAPGTEPATAWPADRRAEFGKLERLLQTLNTLNDSSRFMERLQDCLAVTGELLTMDTATDRPSFVQFLRSEATRLAAVAPAPAAADQGPEALSPVQVTMQGLDHVKPEFKEQAERDYARALLSQFPSVAAARAAQRDYEKTLTTARSFIHANARQKGHMRPWFEAEAHAWGETFAAWPIEPGMAEVAIKVVFTRAPAPAGLTGASEGSAAVRRLDGDERVADL